MAEMIDDVKTLYPSKGKGFKWTVKELESIQPSHKGYRISDSDGLFGKIRVLASGKVSIDFTYPFKWEGRQKWFTCGAFPKHELSAIRNQRDWAKEQLSNGINPCTEKQANTFRHQNEQAQLLQQAELKRMQDLPFQALFDDWIEHGVFRENKNAEIKAAFKKHVLPVIGKKRVRDLAASTLKPVFTQIKEKATPNQPRNRTIQKVHDDLQQLFKWALDNKQWNKLLDYQNPLKQLKLNGFIDKRYIDVRERYLSEPEIIGLATLIQQQKEDYRVAPDKQKASKPVDEKIEIAIWLCLSTMCRIGELLKTKWCEVDLIDAKWTIPAENTKLTRGGNREHIVHLSSFALSKFKQLRHITGNSEWCFPSERNSEKAVDVKSYSKTIGDRQVQFKERTKPLPKRRHDNSLVVGTEKWTMHDLRRTGATIMQGLGISTDIIDLCQNHEIRTKIGRVYQQYEYSDQKKDAWNKLGDHLESILPKT